jgi:hypothetical protein
MLRERLEKLRQEYAGRAVTIDSRRPELVRFADLKGRVVTISHNGRALVEFEGPDRGWYDIELDYLKVVDGLPAEEAAAANADDQKAFEEKPTEKLSRLELARMEKERSDGSREGDAERQEQGEPDRTGS